MEIFETTYACSPSARSGAPVGTRSTGAPSTWTAFGHEGGARVLAPVVATAQGTGVSVAMRDRIYTNAADAAVKATALLPISATDVVGVAGIRSWSPPV